MGLLQRSCIEMSFRKTLIAAWLACFKHTKTSCRETLPLLLEALTLKGIG